MKRMLINATQTEERRLVSRNPEYLEQGVEPLALHSVRISAPRSGQPLSLSLEHIQAQAQQLANTDICTGVWRMQETSDVVHLATRRAALPLSYAYAASDHRCEVIGQVDPAVLVGLCSVRAALSGD